MRARGLALACAVLALAACQVTPPNVPAEISAATGVENALVFHDAPDSSESVMPEGALSPGQALRQSLAHDPRIQAALARVRTAEADANQARLLPNPILNIDLRFPHAAGSNTAFEATLTGDLIQLLQKPAQISAADKRLRESAADALTTALDVMSEIQQAYVAVQSIDAQVANAQQRGEILQQLRDIAKKRLDLGDGTRLDLLTLEAQILQSDLDLADLRLARFEARLNLAKLIGQPRSPAEWPLAPWETAATAIPPPAAESVWIDAALKARPEIHSKLYELSALGDDLTAAEFSPFVGGEMGPHFERDPEWRSGPTLTIPLPIFDFGQASRAKLESQRSGARHELAGLQDDIIQDVRLAYATELHTRRALDDARGKLLPLQQQQLELARRAYQTGEADLTTLLLAQTDLQLTQLKIIELEEKVAVARFKLQRAAGGAAVADPLQTAGASAPAPESQPATSPASGPAGTGAQP